jgi:hypothetical protein
VGTAIILAGVGTVIAVGSFLFSIAAWTIERRDRRADVAEERRVREEQASIDRQRFDLEREDRAARRHAEITAYQREFAPAGDAYWNYDFVLKNLGPSWAKHVSAWLGDYESGDAFTEHLNLGPIDVREERLVTMRVDKAIVHDRRQAALWVKWSDEGGLGHVERSNLHVRLD